jgi:hypothetical protein
LRRDQKIRSAGMGLEHLDRVAIDASHIDGEVVTLPGARRKAVPDAQQRPALRLRQLLRERRCLRAEAHAGIDGRSDQHSRQPGAQVGSQRRRQLERMARHHVVIDVNDQITNGCHGKPLVGKGTVGPQQSLHCSNLPSRFIEQICD